MIDTYLFFRRGIPFVLEQLDVEATLREERATKPRGLVVAEGSATARRLREIHGIAQRELDNLPHGKNLLPRFCFELSRNDVGGLWFFAMAGGGFLACEFQSWEQLGFLELFQELASEQINET